MSPHLNILCTSLAKEYTNTIIHRSREPVTVTVLQRNAGLVQFGGVKVTCTFIKHCDSGLTLITRQILQPPQRYELLVDS